MIQESHAQLTLFNGENAVGLQQRVEKIPLLMVFYFMNNGNIVNRNKLNNVHVVNE